MKNTMIATESVPQAFGIRFGVFRRSRPRGRWVLLLHAGSEDAARKLMLTLQDLPKHRGHADWRVGRLDAHDVAGGALPAQDDSTPAAGDRVTDAR